MKKDMAAFLRRVGSASVKRMKQNIDIIHKETGVSKAFLAMDMLHCTVTYNIGYLDYRVFGFAENRDPKNRRTYMTMHHNSVLSNKLNDRQAISVFIDKPQFNRRFASFLHRDYILLDEKGAADFLQKPVKMEALLPLIARLLAEAREQRVKNERQSLNEAMLSKLTPREQQVLERIVAGRLNKQIADDLGISIKTVEAHRASIMDKTNSGTVADLMRVVMSANKQI